MNAREKKASNDFDFKKEKKNVKTVQKAIVSVCLSSLEDLLLLLRDVHIFDLSFY